MSILNALARERAEQDALNQLGYQRAAQTRYGTIKLSARMYAIIQSDGVSVDHLMKGMPLGIRRFSFVEGCERMTFQDCQDRYRQLLIAEIKEREEKLEKNITEAIESYPFQS